MKIYKEWKERRAKQKRCNALYETSKICGKAAKKIARRGKFYNNDLLETVGMGAYIGQALVDASENSYNKSYSDWVTRWIHRADIYKSNNNPKPNNSPEALFQEHAMKICGSDNFLIMSLRKIKTTTEAWEFLIKIGQSMAAEALELRLEVMGIKETQSPDKEK